MGIVFFLGMALGTGPWPAVTCIWRVYTTTEKQDHRVASQARLNKRAVQELLVEEMVAAVDAMSREAVGEALRMTLSSTAAVSALRSVEALGPLRSLVLPMPLPLDFLSSMGTRMELTREDRQALDTISLLLDMLGSHGTRAQPVYHADFATGVLDSMDSTIRTGTTVVRGAGDLVPLVPELMPGVQHTLERFLAQLLRRWALRFAADLGDGGAEAPAGSP